jgi:hypothetical protein
MSTASALDREMACPASAALPQVRQVTGDAANVGTDTHAFADMVRTCARGLAGEGIAYPEALARARQQFLDEMPDDAEHRALCEALPLDEVPQNAESEVTVAWDPDTKKGRVLGRGLGRDYSKASPTEIVGTADLLWREGDLVCVDDWKTGKAVASGAAGTWQLRLLALAAARAVGVTRTRVRLIYPRADGRVYVDRADFDAFNLLDFERDLQGLDRRISEARITFKEGRTLAVTEGPHCRYCPALPSCPAKRAVVTALVARASQAPDEATVRAQVATLTPALIGETWLKLEAAELYLKRVREAVDSYVRQGGPVPLPGGRELKEVPSTRRYLDPKVAADVLLALDEKEPEERRIAMDAIDYEPSTSAAQIRRALSKHKRKPREADAILKAIDAAGGTIQKISIPVKAVRAGETAIPDAQDETQPRGLAALGG